MATVSLMPAAAKQLNGLRNPIHGRVVRLLARLRSWPAVSGAKALSGNLTGFYRLRTADYRLLFQFKDETVIMHKIGHRRDFYDE